MTDTAIELSEEAFAALFPLRTNHLNPGASWQNADGDGCLFEADGDDIAFVKHCDQRKIWTLVDDDGRGLSILSGFHIANRIGYLASTVPVPIGTNIRVHVASRQPGEFLPARRQRAMKAELAIAQYGSGDATENATDLLTDLRHWCDERGEDFAKFDRLAYRHYIAELDEQAMTKK
jgi:hypothetical protein